MDSNRSLIHYAWQLVLCYNTNTHCTSIYNTRRCGK